MCDAAQIQNLLQRQKRLADERDVDALRRCYTTDTVLTMTINGAHPVRLEGVERVLEHMAAGWARTDEPGSASKRVIHFPGPAEIDEGSADRVRARSMCLYVAADDGQIEGWGNYTDDVVRVDGDWKLGGPIDVGDLRSLSRTRFSVMQGARHGAKRRSRWR